jgi:hypothetical protein
MPPLLLVHSKIPLPIELIEVPSWHVKSLSSNFAITSVNRILFETTAFISLANSSLLAGSEAQLANTVENNNIAMYFIALTTSCGAQAATRRSVPHERIVMFFH